MEAALGLCREMACPQAEARTHATVRLVVRKRGETALARAHFQAALTILHRLGERLHARVIEQALDLLPPSEQQASAE